MKKLKVKAPLRFLVALTMIAFVACGIIGIKATDGGFWITLGLLICAAYFVWLWWMIAFVARIEIRGNQLIIKAPKVKSESLPVMLVIDLTNYHFDTNEISDIQLTRESNPLAGDKVFGKSRLFSYVGKGQATLHVTTKSGETHKANVESFDFSTLKKFIEKEYNIAITK